MTLGPVVLDLQGVTLTDQEQLLIQHPAVGGVILFSRNIETYEQLMILVGEMRALRPELLICVDQEGGRVQRCRDGFTRLPPMQVFDASYDEDAERGLQLAKDCGWLLASEVLATGIDFSFAPVLDVDDDFCSVIGDRAFSATPQKVTALAEAFISGAHEAGMAVTGKHFPGHGSVRGDSHLELPVDNRSLDEVRHKDLVPFNELSATLDAVMPAHILFPQVDEYCAVGFSKVWLSDILRGELSYQGVIFSDDLTMEGATHVGSYCERAQAAIEAGCDMVLVCNNRAGAEEVLSQLGSDLYFQNQGDRASMRARSLVSRSELESSARWQRTVKQLEEFVVLTH